MTEGHQINRVIALKLLAEATELLRDSKRYLTEFGSVEPEVLARKIDFFLTDLALAEAGSDEP